MLRFLVAALICLFSLSAEASISVTSLGTATTTAGATTAITIGAGGVPAGALIVVEVGEATAFNPAGTLADTAGNVYFGQVTTSINPNGNTNNGVGVIFYAWNTAALVNTNTITYTKVVSAHAAVMSAFYATGIDLSIPIDVSVTASATGSSTTPSVTSGTPNDAGELFVAGLVAVAFNGSSNFTQDSGHSWVTPFVDLAVASANEIAGGNQVVSGIATKIFAPTLTNSEAWGVTILGFKPASTSTQGTLPVLGAGHG